MTVLAPTLHQLSHEIRALVEHAADRIALVHARAGRPMHGLAVGRELVLTLDHAIEREAPITVVTPGGRSHQASVAGRDSATNLAVLRAPSLELPPFEAAEDPRPGQLVVAVARQSQGPPRASVTTLQSTAERLRGWRSAWAEPLLRTDGAYGTAFAGAPLVDAAGRLVGIVPAGEWRAAGIALPAPHALRLAETLAREGGIPRAYLGVGCQPVVVPERQRHDASDGRGVLLVTVAEGSPADRGGLLVGDIVVSMAGERVGAPEHLHALLRRLPVGTSQPVDVIRGTAREVLEITLGRRP